MLMQNFGVTNKEHYGMLWYFWSGQFFCAWIQGKEFREWILKKLIQGEQACHRATDFAKLHVSIPSNAFVYSVLGSM